jgi:hypothetical protein
VKSFIAALRVLVLPFGATTGRRIVLDGINGVIQFYDANNVLRMELGRLADTIELYSGLTGEDDPAELAAFGLNAGAANQQAALRLASPQFAAPDNLQSEIKLYSEADDGTAQPSITISTELVELVAATIANGVELNLLGTVTAAARLFVGGGTAFPDVDIADGVIEIESGGDIQLDNISLPRGGRNTNDLAVQTGDITLSTTAGTYTTLVEKTGVSCKAGRLYEITFSGADNFLTGGSGFATTDNWRHRLARKIGAGAYATMKAQALIRCHVAAAQRYPLRVLIGYFSPSSDATVDFKCEMTKVAGAATVTTSVQNDAANNGMHLMIKDIGASSAALN